MAYPPFSFDRYMSNPPPISLSPSALSVNPTQTVSKSWHCFVDDPNVLSQAVQYCASSGVEGDVLSHFDAFISYVRQHRLPQHLAMWLAIRIAVSNDEFVVPRPHRDGCYWNPSISEESFKFGAVLVGPGTLFWRVSEEGNRAYEDARAKARAEGRDVDGDVEVRRGLLAVLEGKGGECVVPGVGEVVKWYVAHVGKAAIHSEPDMSDMPGGRVFVMVLLGTEEQIVERAGKEGEVFSKEL